MIQAIFPSSIAESNIAENFKFFRTLLHEIEKSARRACPSKPVRGLSTHDVAFIEAMKLWLELNDESGKPKDVHVIITSGLSINASRLVELAQHVPHRNKELLPALIQKLVRIEDNPRFLDKLSHVMLQCIQIGRWDGVIGAGVTLTMCWYTNAHITICSIVLGLMFWLY